VATSYPDGLDNFTNPTASDTLDSATVPHATQHANANDAIEAIETELGTDPKGSKASVKARLDDVDVQLADLGDTSIATSLPLTSSGTVVGDNLTIGINSSSADTANYVVRRDANGEFVTAAVTIDPTNTPTSAVGKLYWDGGGTVNLGLLGGNVSAALGENLFSYVTNAEATTLAIGEVVYVYGAQGNRISVKRASNSGESTSSKTLGIVAESIATNQSGFVITRGLIEKMTLGSYTEGAPVYLGSTAGTFTSTKPSAPNHLVSLGWVIRANNGNGQIYVNVQNGFELDELHDVSIVSKADGQFLIYDGPTSLWKNQAISATAPITFNAATHTIAASDASTSASGVVQLSDSTSTTSSVLASTPTATKSAYDLANTANTTANAATPTTRTISTTAPIAGGGDLSANRTLSLNIGSSLTTSASNLIVDSTVVPYLTTANTFTAANTLSPATSATALTISPISGASKGISYQAAVNKSATITNAVGNGTTVTYTATNTFVVGETVSITGVNPSAYNLSNQIIVTASSSLFTVTNAATGTYVSGGTAQVFPTATANALEIKDYGGGVKFKVDSYGLMQATRGATISSSANETNLSIGAGSNTTAVTLIVKLGASQTGSLTEWQNSAGTMLTKVNSDGSMYVNSILQVQTTNQGVYLYNASDQTQISVNRNPATAAFNTSSAPAAIMIIRTQSNDSYFQFFTSNANNSYGSERLRITSGGLILINSTSSTLGSGSVASQLGVVAGAATTVGAVIRGAASQTGNLTEWQDSSGGILAKVGSDGQFTIGGSSTATIDAFGNITSRTGGTNYSANISIRTGATFYIGMVVRGVANQTADLQQFQTSAGTVIGGRNALAQIYTGSTSPILVATGGATTAATGDGTTATITTTSAHGLAVGDLVTVAGVTPTGYNSTALVTAVATNTISYLNATTGAQTVAGTVSVPAQSSITPRSVGTVGLVVKALSGQSANAQEWQTSAGSATTFIDSTLRLVTRGITSIGYSAAQTSAQLGINTNGGTARVGIIMQGSSGQTSDLQQWQALSGPTTLSGVNAAGQIYAGTTASVVGSTTTALTSAAYTSATVAVFTYGGTSLVQAGQRVTVAGVTGGTYNGTWTVSAVTATTFTVLGSGFTNVAGSGGTFQLSAVGSFVAGTAAITPLVVQGNASQTASLQQWQFSDGTSTVVMDAIGRTSIGTSNVYGTNQYGRFSARGNGASESYSVDINGSTSATGLLAVARIRSSVATEVTLIVQGFTAQSGDLQSWKNSSGTTLSAITSAGTINFASGNTSATATAGAVTLPALAVGYITMQVAGTTVKVPYYAN
jgi:hypothetical protein